MSEFQIQKSKIFNLPFLVFGIFAIIGLYFLYIRFTQGMGATSNLNEGYAFGIWVTFDIVVATALACGGYALALMVYVFNKGQYHPLMRSAVLASLLGYAMGGLGAFVDMGRWHQFYTMFLPWNMNFNSVMLEIGLCVATYITILMIEFLPAFLERIGAKGLLNILNKVLFFFIALGILLPTMHQSSLGSMLIAMGHKVHPLWQSWQLQPLLAIITVLIMGFSMAIYESSLVEAGFRRPSEMPLLAKLWKVIVGLLIVYFIVRFGDILYRGKLPMIFNDGFNSIMFILETLLFAFPLFILLTRSKNSFMLALAALSMLLAGSLYRFNAYLVTFNPGPGYSYFPSVPEILITLGIVSIEILLYMFLVKTLPVLPNLSVKHQH